jgi:hypothetical protein
MDDCFDDNPGWMLTLSWGQQGRQSMKNAADRFLTNPGCLETGPERLDLDDLPDVTGLKAFRVGVNLSAHRPGTYPE